MQSVSVCLHKEIVEHDCAAQQLTLINMSKKESNTLMLAVENTSNWFMLILKWSLSYFPSSLPLTLNSPKYATPKAIWPLSKFQNPWNSVEAQSRHFYKKLETEPNYRAPQVCYLSWKDFASFHSDFGDKMFLCHYRWPECSSSHSPLKFLLCLDPSLHFSTFSVLPPSTHSPKALMGQVAPWQLLTDRLRFFSGRFLCSCPLPSTPG